MPCGYRHNSWIKGAARNAGKSLDNHAPGGKADETVAKKRSTDDAGRCRASAGDGIGVG
jgi:hypothetical protein